VRQTANKWSFSRKRRQVIVRHLFATSALYEEIGFLEAPTSKTLPTQNIKGFYEIPLFPYLGTMASSGGESKFLKNYVVQ
jgi:hypothetical protein